MTLTNAHRTKILVCALLAMGATALYGRTIGSGVAVPATPSQPAGAPAVLASASAPAAACAVRPAASFC